MIHVRVKCPDYKGEMCDGSLGLCVLFDGECKGVKGSPCSPSNYCDIRGGYFEEWLDESELGKEK